MCSEVPFLAATLSKFISVSQNLYTITYYKICRKTESVGLLHPFRMSPSFSPHHRHVCRSVSESAMTFDVP